MTIRSFDNSAAEMLGFEATGIEIDPTLASAARQLLADFGFTAMVETGSYFDLYHHADSGLVGSLEK